MALQYADHSRHISSALLIPLTRAPPSFARSPHIDPLANLLGMGQSSFLAAEGAGVLCQAAERQSGQAAPTPLGSQGPRVWVPLGAL